MICRESLSLSALSMYYCSLHAYLSVSLLASRCYRLLQQSLQCLLSLSASSATRCLSARWSISFGPVRWWNDGSLCFFRDESLVCILSYKVTSCANVNEHRIVTKSNSLLIHSFDEYSSTAQNKKSKKAELLLLLQQRRHKQSHLDSAAAALALFTRSAR